MSIDFANATFDAGGTTQTLLELVKSILGVTDNSRDAELSMMIDIAGAAAEKYIDNKLVEQPVTELFRNAFSPISLRYWPATNLTTVLVDGEDLTANYAEYTEDGIHWVVREVNGSNQCWSQVNVTYDAGYDPLPSEVAYAIARGAIAYDSDVVSTGPVKRESVVGVGSIEYDTALTASTSVGMLPASSIAALNPYRRYHV